jgi:ubiquinol-cytochrome c reductase cytochrome c subunit
MKRLLSALAVVLVLAGATAASTVAIASDGDQPAADRSAATAEELFLFHCSSCHGQDGAGGLGPTLVGVGAAAADFQLRTGRMPLADINAFPSRKPSPFTQDQIDALTAYVASFGPGPPVPVVDTSSADLARGGDLFRTNCASCHGAAARGGALSSGWNAPDLYAADPTEIVEAVRTGPGQMPTFDEEHITSDEAADIARYVGFLQTEPDPGGLGLGRLGPVPEGLVAWVFGLGTVILAAGFIERRSN